MHWNVLSKQQLFTTPNGRGSRCSQTQDASPHRKSVAGARIGISLSPLAEVFMVPYGEGDSIDFRDAQLIKVSDQRELNFLLAPFLSRQVPSSMKVDAAHLLRKALEGSTASSGYKVSLERLKVHSMQIQGDTLVVNVDGDITVK
jgi:hypothetical protein